MSELKVNQKIWEVKIRNAVVEKSYRKNGVIVNEYEILGISHCKICLNDDWFTCLTPLEKGKKKESYCTYVNQIITNIRVNDNILGDGIFVTCYSSTKPTKKLLNKMAADAGIEIEKRFGFLMNGSKETIYELVDKFKL